MHSTAGATTTANTALMLYWTKVKLKCHCFLWYFHPQYDLILLNITSTIWSLSKPLSKQSNYSRGLFLCSCSESQQHLHVECNAERGLWLWRPNKGEDLQLLTGLPHPWAGCLPLCLCLLLPVSHPWQHSGREQLMEGNTFHSNQARLSSPFC